MKNIEVIDRYCVRFYKPAWPEGEFATGMSLGFKRAHKTAFIADTREVAPDAIMGFMKQCFPTVLLSQSQHHFKTALFAHLRKMYTANYQEFINGYYPKSKYERDLYKHQKKALSLMLHKQFNLLSFEQGLGKTITSATLSKLLSIQRTIVICPSLVKWNWYHDMTDDWGYNPIYWTILDSRKSKCIYAFRERFVVINYEMIPKYLDYLTKDPVGHIIIDECQYIKNHTTKRYKGVAKLVEAFPAAKVTLLSGTPITNRINDLFAYCKLTGHHLGKNYKKFKERYTESIKARGGNKIVGAKNIDELRLRMSNFMIRKKTEECIDLPELLIKKYYFEANELDAEYEETLEKMYQQKKQYDLADKQEKMKIQAAMRTNLHTLNRIVSTSKASHIKKLVDSLWESGRKVIVFAGYKDALSALEEIYGDACVKIDGSVPAHTRQMLIDKFINDPSCHVFLGNFKAAGVGINLVNARDVIFMNFPFTPDDLEQPYKRAHRIGQKQNVNVYYTIAKETIDERIFDMIVDKTQDINALIDDGKEGVVHYPQIQNKLWKNLMNEYEVSRGIKPESEGSFASIK